MPRVLREEWYEPIVSERHVMLFVEVCENGRERGGLTDKSSPQPEG